MKTVTRIEPLTEQRAAELFEVMSKVADDPQLALALDDDGCVTGAVPADTTEHEHLAGDFDVHA